MATARVHSVVSLGSGNDTNVFYHRAEVEMPFDIACPSCGKTFSVNEALIGKNGKCGKCGTRFVISARIPELPLQEHANHDSSKSNLGPSTSPNLLAVDAAKLSRGVAALTAKAFSSPGPLFNVQRQTVLTAWLTNFATNLNAVSSGIEKRRDMAGNSITLSQLADGIERMCSQYSRSDIIQRLEAVCGNEIGSEFLEIVGRSLKLAQQLRGDETSEPEVVSIPTQLESQRPSVDSGRSTASRNEPPAIGDCSSHEARVRALAKTFGPRYEIKWESFAQLEQLIQQGRSGCDRIRLELACPLDLRNANLADLKFYGFDFSNADLRGAYFANSLIELCTFRNALLNGACFRQCVIAGADFGGSVLDDADFTRANMQEHIHAYEVEHSLLFGQHKERIIMSHCSFAGASMQRSNFTKGSIDGDFSDARMTDANFQSCTIFAKKWNKQTDVTGANFAGCSIPRKIGTKGFTEVLSPDQIQKTKACFIATAACGHEDSWELLVLREYRNNILLPSRWGSVLVAFYYSVSRPLADLLVSHPFLRKTARLLLVRPLARSVAKLMGRPTPCEGSLGLARRVAEDSEAETPLSWSKRDRIEQSETHQQLDRGRSS